MGSLGKNRKKFLALAIAYHCRCRQLCLAMQQLLQKQVERM